MKKTLLTFGAFLTVVFCTLAFAANSEGHWMRVAIATPSATSSDEEVPNYGVSIGTVEAQAYSESGLSFSYFSNADYVAQTSEGTYMGFQLSSDWVYDEATGESNQVYYATLVAINSSEDAVTIPDNIKVGDNTYPVTRILGYGDLRDGFNPNIKTLTIPSTVNNVFVNYSFDSYLDAIYMLGAAPAVSWAAFHVSKIYVCDRTYFASYSNNEGFSDSAILPYGWDFEWMTVNVGRKGEFAQTYIEMTDADWSLGCYVKITGSLNSTDLGNIKNLTNLIKLDLSEAEFTSLPTSFLPKASSLSEVILPDDLTAISSSAFRYCYKLEKVVATGVNKVDDNAFYNCYKLSVFDISNVNHIGSQAFYNCKVFNPIVLSDELVTIGSYAFYNTGITEVSLPQTMKSISYRVFSNCKRLSKVVLPLSITTIDSYAFNECSNLIEINLPEGISTIDSDAFNRCTSLSEITLPSTLQSIGYTIFDGCSSLTTVKCKAIVPPTTNGGFTNGVDLNHCTLYIAPFTIDAYRAAADWSNFYIMKPLNEPVKNIYVNRPMAFDLLSEDNAVLQENPNMTLDYSGSNSVGQLSASGDGTLSAGIFTIYHSFGRRQSPSTTDYRTTLVNNAENMRADSVLCSISFEKNTWHFISFQYDVQMSDVYGLNNTDFVIRQYNSANRAMGDGTTSNWETVPSDGVLEAGKGYIIQAANNTTNEKGNSRLAVVRFPSRNTVTKNKLFTSNNVIVPLEEYPSEFAHNRSWNLVGNPYPCYYDMHYLMDDFTTPIVLWRGTSYQAYSPVDDDIILRPNEAFFVQRPLDAEQMVFGADGRMDYSEAYNATNYNNSTPGINYAPARNTSDNQRSVFNFNIDGGGNNDRTRVVINEEASMEYEINRDASKFFAESCQGVEIYVDGDIKYDICERPLESGVATLGTRIASDGVYSISLNGRNIEGWSVILTDTKTGSTVDLTESAYVFEAEAGTEASRFLITFKATGPLSIDEISASASDGIVRIVNISGVNVYEGTLDNFTKSAPAGVYIVVAKDETFKIVVK